MRAAQAEPLPEACGCLRRAGCMGPERGVGCDMPRYNRVLLKLSGEVLAGDERFGLDFDAVRRVGAEMVELHGAGIQLSLVVGGGNMLRGRDVRHMEKGRIVIFAAGTGHPFFSTDTTAALRAAEMGVDCMVKGTKVDGIYEADPKSHPEARFFPHLSYSEALQRNIEVMDASAFSLCRENRIPILVLNVQRKGCLVSALVNGERIGTIVEDA